MPPRLNSRYTFTVASTDDDGVTSLSDVTPFGYQPFEDNIQHSVVTGDTLYSLAAYYYQGLTRPDGLWWAIADFQLPPILDPTIQLQEGSIIVVPSVRTIQESVFSEKRRGV